jgi:alanine racemase
VLGGIIGDQLAQFIEHDLTITASSIFKLDLIEDAARSLQKRAKIHVKIDTGMERLGVHHYSCDELLEAVTRSEWCDLCGVFSHLSSSEAADKSFTNLQLERFLEATDWFNQRSLPMPLRHLANSGGILQHPSTHMDMVRPGIMLYGVYPGDDVKQTVNLQPVLSFKTRVVFFKVVKAGAGVGYNGTWTAPHDTRVVTLPVGYGDGYRRSLSNKGEVLIRGARCKISVEELARRTDTISYEVLTGINTRVPRVYV